MNGIQKVELVGQLKKLHDNGNATDTVDEKNMFVSMVFKKVKETRLQLS